MELSPELIISSILVPLIGGIVVYLVTQINPSGERMAEFSNKVSDAMSVIAQRVASLEESNRANEDNIATLRSDFRVHDEQEQRRQEETTRTLHELRLLLERLARAVESVCVYFTKG